MRRGKETELSILPYNSCLLLKSTRSSWIRHSCVFTRFSRKISHPLCVFPRVREQLKTSSNFSSFTRIWWFLPSDSSVCLWIRWRDYCSLYTSAWRPTLQMRAWERKEDRVKNTVGEIQTRLKLESWEDMLESRLMGKIYLWMCRRKKKRGRKQYQQKVQSKHC